MAQALLSSPLTLDQTYGILLMSDGMLDPEDVSSSIAETLKC